MDKVKCLECPVNDGFIKSFNYDVIMVSPDNSEEKRLFFFLIGLAKIERKKERKTWSNQYVEGSLRILEKEVSHHLFICRISKPTPQGRSHCPLS